MLEFFRKLKELRLGFIFNEESIKKSWICQSFQWFVYYGAMSWIFTGLKYYVWYYAKLGMIRVIYPDWVALNVVKDFHIVMFILFVVNFFIVVIQFHIDQTRQNWFNIDPSITSINEVPLDVQSTWIYKHTFTYLFNHNVLLFFICIIEFDHLLARPLILLQDGVVMITICSLIHICFWLNYFFIYSKRKNNIN